MRDRRERVRGGTKIVAAITIPALAAIGVVSQQRAAELEQAWRDASDGGRRAHSHRTSQSRSGVSSRS
jgi:hypothetical protein